jgi:hypothetical protein
MLKHDISDSRHEASKVYKETNSRCDSGNSRGTSTCAVLIASTTTITAATLEIIRRPLLILEI